MRRSPLLRLVALLAALAVTASGCGLSEDPVHATPEEVLDALDDLRDGAEVRATAELAVDDGELRAALRGDPGAQQVLHDALGRHGSTDLDALLARLEEAQAALTDHALLLATGRDGSSRLAAEYRERVWADLRVGGPTTPVAPTDSLDPAGEQDGTDGPHLDLQLRMDWATAAEVLARPDLLGDLDEAAAAVAPLLGTDLELDAVEQVLLAFLAGELVGVRGAVGPDLLAALRVTRAGRAVPVGPLGTLSALGPREVARVALAFDDFRRDGDDTLVDVSLEVHAAAGLALDRLAEAPAALGMSPKDVEEARAAVARLPERLTDVAVLRFDGAGLLRQVRLDVLDVLLQVARETEPTDREVQIAARLAAELDATGVFVVLDIEGVGTTASVLGEPIVTVSPQELARALGALGLGRPATGSGTGD